MPAQSALKYLSLAIAILLFASPTVISSVHTQYSHAQTRSGSLGVIIPMYAYPGSTWTSIIQVKQAYPNVPFIVVVSPSSGPGSYPDQNFVKGIQQLQSAGIQVAGYVDTMYTGASISSVESQVNDYNSWYHVNGIMFDDMMNTLGTENYYATLNSYAHSVGIGLTIGNPGATVPASEAGVFDILNVYESPGLPSLSSLYYNAPTSDFALIAYSTSYSTSYIQNAANYVGYIYLTDLSYPNPWDFLPSYFTTEVALLSSMDGAGSQSGGSPAPNPSGSTSSLTVKSVNSLGNPISGYYTQLDTSAGSTVTSGYTPSTFTLSDGASYQIEADSYGPCTFSHWSGGSLGGSTTDPAHISISSDATINAVYTGSSCGSQASSAGSASGSSTGGSGQATITVKTVSTDGSSFSGMYVTIQNGNGNTVDSGYTPLTFTGTIGSTYKINTNNWQSYVFNNWASGSSNPSATITLGQNTALTAIYSTPGSSGGSSANSPSDNGGSKVTVTINSADLSGNRFSGMWVQVTDSSGNIIAHGYTSLTVTLTAGSQYKVSMANWENYVFSNWAGGSSNPSRIITPSQSTTITAYYYT